MYDHLEAAVSLKLWPISATEQTVSHETITTLHVITMTACSFWVLSYIPHSLLTDLDLAVQIYKRFKDNS